ncbi:class I SAM-dependent methyltransferase [Rhizobium sp. PP-F2F-G48]|uniref:class I SAM-dependent methyltransferase n=1 Tax=Rhizobium sp. PP-F2F-G48 TaxID=2135651 RepID=UPI001FE0FB58|nr:class I SAM-dependent methyltransferase [Rhizobium sp. PP-F2F-G48]
MASDYEKFLEECDRAPRLNGMAEFFENAAAGRRDVPHVRPAVDMRLMPADPSLYRFVERHARRQGQFDQHYHASIPYRLEEECRMGHAILCYSQTRSRKLNFYSLGTAEGTMARTLSELTDGKIRSLSCSPTEANRASFLAFGSPPNAHFFLGPFHRLTKEYLRNEPDLAIFEEGFDVILEDTTFQMYSPNRRSQLAFVKQHLKPDGILLLVEKFRAEDNADYHRRELQKDFGFKARYFDASTIERKARDVLSTMYGGEITLSEMATAILSLFQYCMITWNSGNFYGLAASDSEENLYRYLSSMIAPAVPGEYVYKPEPYSDLGDVLAFKDDRPPA